MSGEIGYDAGVRRRRLTDRLTYANVLATVALFISLGGASYAVVSLPARSVGTEQLKTAAVTSRALGFPLGVDEITNNKARQNLERNSCNTPGPPFIACTLTELRAGPSIGAVQLRRPGRLAITALVTLASEAPTATTAIAEVALFANKHAIDDRTIDVSGGTAGFELAMQGSAALPAGKISIELAARARHYSTTGPGDAYIESVSVIATALPLT